MSKNLGLNFHQRSQSTGELESLGSSSTFLFPIPRESLTEKYCYRNLQANARSIQTASAALKQAQEGLEIARVRFQAGVGTQLEVITAENDLTRADVNRLRAILNYNRALAALQRAVRPRR